MINLNLKKWTWKEFKEKIESTGVLDSDLIWYIDINSECDSFVSVFKEEKRGVEITNYPDM